MSPLVGTALGAVERCEQDLVGSTQLDRCCEKHTQNTRHSFGLVWQANLTLKTLNLKAALCAHSCTRQVRHDVCICWHEAEQVGLHYLPCFHSHAVPSLFLVRIAKTHFWVSACSDERSITTQCAHNSCTTGTTEPSHSWLAVLSNTLPQIIMWEDSHSVALMLRISRCTVPATPSAQTPMVRMSLRVLASGQ